MPRKSLRREAINLMKAHVHKLYTASIGRQVLNEEDLFEDYKLAHHTSVLQQMIDNRYLFRSPYYRKDRNKFDIDNALSFNSVNYNNEEFVYAFRMSRESFLYCWKR